MTVHRIKIATPADAPQRTDGQDLSVQHLRDAVGNYSAHARLEGTPVGRKILDTSTELHRALHETMMEKFGPDGTRVSGMSSTEWFRTSGFRSPGDLRKVWSGEMVGTLTDVAVAAELDPASFVRFAEAVAHLAGGRFEPVKVDPASLARSIAKATRTGAELSAQLHESTSQASDGGEGLTKREKDGLLEVLGEHKEAVAEVESQLVSGSRS